MDWLAFTIVTLGAAVLVGASLELGRRIERIHWARHPAAKLAHIVTVVGEHTKPGQVGAVILIERDAAGDVGVRVQLQHDHPAADVLPEGQV